MCNADYMLVHVSGHDARLRILYNTIVNAGRARHAVSDKFRNYLDGYSGGCREYIFLTCCFRLVALRNSGMYVTVASVAKRAEAILAGIDTILYA